MVNHISGANSDAVQSQRELLLQGVEHVKTAKSDETLKQELLGDDNANISDKAIELWQNDRETLYYSRLAERMPEEAANSKIAYLKDLVDSGRAEEYLASIDTDALASALMNSPMQAYLGK